MLKLISVLICYEHCLMTNTICANHVKTLCNIKRKPLAHILGPGSGFLTLSLQFRSWVMDLGSWVLCFRSQVQCLRSQVPSLGSWVHSLFSVTCILSVTVITKCDRKLFQSITKNYYKVWHLLQSVREFT